MDISLPRSLTKGKSTSTSITTVAVETGWPASVPTTTLKAVSTQPLPKNRQGKSFFNRKANADDELLFEYSNFTVDHWAKLDLEDIEDVDLGNLEGFERACEVKKGEDGRTEDVVENTWGQQQVYDLCGSGEAPVRKSGGALWETQAQYQASQKRLATWAKETEVINYEVLFDAENSAAGVELDAKKVVSQFARLRKPGEGDLFEDGIDPTLSFLGERSPSRQSVTRSGFGELPSSEVIPLVTQSDDVHMHRVLDSSLYEAKAEDGINENALEHVPSWRRAPRELIDRNFAKNSASKVFSGEEGHEEAAAGRNSEDASSLTGSLTSAHVGQEQCQTVYKASSGDDFEDVKLDGLSLAELIPGLNSAFLPGIEHLTNPTLQILRIANPDPPQQELEPVEDGATSDSETDSEDDDTEDVCEAIDTYVDVSNSDVGVNQVGGTISFVANTQQQVGYTALTHLPGSSEFECSSQADTIEDKKEEDDIEEIQHTLAIFFDASTQQEIGYTALNQLLQPSEEDLARIHRADQGFDLEEFSWPGLDLREITDTTENEGYASQEPEPQDVQVELEWPIMLDLPQRLRRRINSNLLAINELSEGALPSPSSDSSIDFADRRGFAKPVPSRRAGFLGDEFEPIGPELYETRPLPALPPIRQLYETKPLPALPFTAVFSSTIWRDEPVLTFTIPELARIDLPVRVENSDELGDASDGSQTRIGTQSRSSEVSAISLREPEIAIRALELFTEDYVQRIQTGQLEEIALTCKDIRQDCTCRVPSGYKDYTIEEMAWRIQELYDSLSMTALQVCEETPVAHLKCLHELRSEIKACITYQKKSSSSLLEMSDMRFMANRFWNVAFSCMREIEKAHRNLMKMPCMAHRAGEAFLTEQLMWSDWLNCIRESVTRVDGGDSEVDLSRMPSVHDFLLASLYWWDGKIFQAMRRTECIG